VENKSRDKKNIPVSSGQVPSECPHCGKSLSPWQQVLLRVDRVLTCKNCWYRIILKVQHGDQNDINSEQPEKE